MTDPVTTTGWYANKNGSITYRFWQNGLPCEGATLASWDELASILEGEDRDRAARYADDPVTVDVLP